MAAAGNERIILGSGYIHIKEFTGTLPTTTEMCTNDTLFSYISGGATLSYTPEVYEAKDDLAKVSKTILVNEEVTLTSGLMTLCGNTIEKLCDTARVTETQATATKAGKRTVKIGGVSNQTGKRYCICFHHVDKVDGDIYIMIVGQNQAGFELSFAKDSESIVDAEFKALPHDSEGTLVVYEEELPATGSTGE